MGVFSGSMRSLFCFLLVIFSALLLEVPLASGKAKHQLKHDVTDAFKMFEVVTSAVAVLDADGDGDLDCVVVVREHLDENKKTARYVWLLPSLNGRQAENLTYHLKEGPTPDKPVLTVDDGADGEKTANFIYTNYKNCVVVDIPFKKKRSCGLWVTKDAVHSVPQECVDQFEDNCDMEVAVFDDETCKGVLDNI
ncbi:uncharacterized protein LOC119441915 isoform X2 [Dermacentor silvarum]|uniref:uncharacterized protein LOC119441915 isoform X2 n=1 Tax=Dermacentor silvarum TaxID=543639 RepID=UPI002100C30E|nr:uncharacterized protein LOC119441915 isoform X2 [Dermacentor silvarum]